MTSSSRCLEANFCRIPRCSLDLLHFRRHGVRIGRSTRNILLEQFQAVSSVLLAALPSSRRRLFDLKNLYLVRPAERAGADAQRPVAHRWRLCARSRHGVVRRRKGRDSGRATRNHGAGGAPRAARPPARPRLAHARGVTPAGTALGRETRARCPVEVRPDSGEAEMLAAPA